MRSILSLLLATSCVTGAAAAVLPIFPQITNNPSLYAASHATQSGQHGNSNVQSIGINSDPATQTFSGNATEDFPNLPFPSIFLDNENSFAPLEFVSPDYKFEIANMQMTVAPVSISPSSMTSVCQFNYDSAHPNFGNDITLSVTSTGCSLESQPNPTRQYCGGSKDYPQSYDPKTMECIIVNNPTHIPVHLHQEGSLIFVLPTPTS